MKKAQRVGTQSDASCVLLHDSVSMSLQRVRIIPRFFLRICLAVLGVCSAFASLFGFFDFPVSKPRFFAALVIMTIFCSVGFRVRKLTKWMCLLLIGAVAFLFWRYHAEIIYGFGSFVEIISATLSDRDFTRFDPVSVYDWSWKKCLSAAMMLFGLLISFAVAALTVRKPSFCAVFFLLFMFVEIGLFRGLRTHSLAVFGLIAYWAAMIVLSDGDTTFGRQNKSNAMFVYTEHALYAKPNMRFMPTEFIAAFLAVLVLLFGGMVHLAVRHYESGDTVNSIRSEIRAGWKRMIENMADFSLFGDDGIDHTEQPGDIALNGQLNPVFTGETAFTVKIDLNGEPQTMYLKQDTRAVYTGKAWRELSDETYEVWDSLFDKMYDLGIAPQAPEYINPYLPEQDISYLTYESRLNAYEKCLPYRAYFDDSAELWGDTAMWLTEPDALTYGFASYDPDLFSQVLFPPTSSASLKDYISRKHEEVYNQYNSFVRVNYLQVPSGDGMEAIRADAAELLEFRYYNTQRALFAIREYLSEKAVYTLTPPVVPENVDYASYFLLESGEGYCVHYATAAVLLCRMMGIPARYAQGYVIFESDFSNPEITSVDGSAYTVHVPDNRAHAWAEVYLPGYGWLPFEFTAGYIAEDSTQAVLTEPSETTTLSTQTTTTTTLTSTTGSTGSSTASQTSETTVSTQGSSSQGTVFCAVGKVLVKLLIAALAAAVIALLYLLLHRYLYTRRENAMHHTLPDKAASASYGYLLRLLAREGIVRQPQQSHESFAQMAEENCAAVPEGAMQRAVETQLAVTFSRDGVTREQAAELTAFVEELVQRIYQTASPLKRLLMRWVYHDIQ